MDGNSQTNVTLCPAWMTWGNSLTYQLSFNDLVLFTFCLKIELDDMDRTVSPALVGPIQRDVTMEEG